jgi:Uma2 family endonuclease
MAMPAAMDRYYTREEVLAFPEDGHRYELVHGELLVSPGPRWLHQWIVVQLLTAVNAYVRRHRFGTTLSALADLSLGRDDSLVQPDLFVVAGEGAQRLDGWQLHQLLLVIEVLSPSTSRHDRFTKRRLYQEIGVPLYWIIDAETRRAEVWTPEATAPVYETERVIWQPAGVPVSLTIELRPIFAP